MATASDSDAGAQPRDDPSLLPFASFSFALSIRAPATPTLASVPSTIHLPTQISTLAVCLHPSAAQPLPRRPTRLNSATYSVISPLPSSTPGLSRSFPSGAPAASGRRRTLVWFRADLRLHDHEPFHAAAGASSSLLPVFVFDPRDFGKSPSGFDRTGPYRANFLLDSVADLRRSLRARGGDLVVRVGRPEVVIPELARAAGAEAVYAHGEVSRDEVRTEERVQKAVEKEGINVKYFWGSTLYHVEDLPFRLDDMPSNYGGFREAVKRLDVRKVLEAPEEVKCVPMKNVLEPGDIPTLAELGLTAPPAMAQDSKPAVGSTLIGGETGALERLKKFAAECSMQPNKADKSNTQDSIYGANFSCKISPWLATGCLSPRFMYEELKKHATRAISSESTPKNNDGTSDAGTNWLMFELLWRDFFRFITKKYSSVQKTSEVATGCTPAPALA
ncbi:Blue-light photoreceptor PHR2 [Zea mays]|uniref:Blue-light photoreceptor PHR2 n=2 Tax=Zea mays TaxID=4577 RepID=A0A1D6PAR6_MAIZE|nr:blue-light photoreceptor PHR2 [Zea mays]AQL06786.1 Blue-light photoreceptor PHR2 [Zea mays]PWZ06310.1 Blue-light photoreceptor PHR2 [Zea mays]|eukprot:XP_020399823.1 blue-light photoreceptor PHR2 [Zea mays]